MALTFNDFVQIELPKRPFTSGDGQAGQTVVRSSNPLAVRELVWQDLPSDGVLTIAAGAAGIAGHRAVMIAQTGELVHADPAYAEGFVGISTNAAISGDPVNILTRDFVEEVSWNWIPGLPIYYVADGVLTQTVPQQVVVPIATAYSATKILISRLTPIFLQGA